MNEPLETLHLKEGVICPVPWKDRNVFGKLKPFIYTIAVIIILTSLLLRTNMFSELGHHSQIMIVILLLFVMLESTDEWYPSDLDMVFYEDRIELIRERVYRGRKFYRHEWQRMYYKDMHDIKRRMNAKKLEIDGIARGVYHEYDKKTGLLNGNPSWDKTVDAGFVLYYDFMDIDMVVQKLEKYTQLEVVERMT